MKVRLIAKQKCTFLIDNDIAYDIIANLIFDSNVECPDADEISQHEKAKKSALQCFTYNEDESIFMVTTKSTLKMNMIVKFISVGVSFRLESHFSTASVSERRDGNGCDWKVSAKGWFHNIVV